MSCSGGIFGPKLTVLEIDKNANFSKTEKVEFYFSEKADPTHGSYIPKGLRYHQIAKVRIKGKMPSQTGNVNDPMFPFVAKRSYTQSILNSYYDMAVALEDKAKELGADTVIIQNIKYVREQRVDAVSYSLDKKVLIGPWFDIPIWDALLARRL